MKVRFKIQMFTGLTAFAFIMIAAKLFNDFIYIFEKEEVAAFGIGFYLVLMVVAGWINDFGNSFSVKSKTASYSVKALNCKRCGKVIGYEDSNGDGKIRGCPCGEFRYPERKNGYDYCEKCNKELGKTLPAGSGYRGGCDCELGSPPGGENEFAFPDGVAHADIYKMVALCSSLYHIRMKISHEDMIRYLEKFDSEASYAEKEDIVMELHKSLDKFKDLCIKFRAKHLDISQVMGEAFKDFDNITIVEDKNEV